MKNLRFEKLHSARRWMSVGMTFMLMLSVCLPAAMPRSLSVEVLAAETDTFELTEEAPLSIEDVMGASELEWEGVENAPERGQETPKVTLRSRMLMTKSLQSAAGEEALSSQMEEDLPLKYDPRTIQGLGMPEFRNQNPTSLCWTFGCLSTMEMNLIRKGLAMSDTIDLSERHLAYYFFNKGNLNDPLGNTEGDYNTATDSYGNNIYTDIGGNNYLTIWHLTGWVGAVEESEAPFEALANNTRADLSGLCGQENSLSMAYEKDVTHLQNAYVINIGNSWNDEALRNKMKALIQTYGAIGTGYRAVASATYDNPDPDCDCYFYDGTNWSTNHNITIIGWDDEFPKEKFNEKHRPKNNGAWLVRNSYGGESSTRAQYGCFWLSYEDCGLRQVSGSNSYKYGFILDCEAADNYDHLYLYDGSANFRNCPYEVSGGAAIYEVKGTEQQLLSAVGLGVKTEGISYTLKIYTGVEEGKPESGTLALSQEGSLSYSGYHTIPLEKEIKVSKGERYSIVFTGLHKTGSQDKIVLHAAHSEKMTASTGKYWNFHAKSNPGETFCKTAEGANWVDLSEFAMGNYTVTQNGKQTQYKNQIFVKSKVDSYDNVTRDGYSLRIRGYTKDAVSENSISENSSISDNDSGQGGQGGSGNEKDPTQGGSGEDLQDGPKEGAKEPELISLTLNQTKAVMKEKETLQLTAKPVFKDSPGDLEVTWTSADPGVASVTGYGFVTAKKPGRTMITVSAGKLSAQCEIAIAPKTPQITSLKRTGKTLKNTGLTISFATSEGADGYVLYRKRKGKDSFSVYRVLSKDSTRVKVPAISDNQPFYYKVAAFVETRDGERLLSKKSELCVVTGCVKKVTAKREGNKSCRLTWSAANLADGYVILRSQKKNGGFKRIKTLKTTKYIDGRIKTGKTYHYRIRPYIRIGKKKILGKSISITSK